MLRSYWLALLAEAYGARGQVEEGLNALTDPTARARPLSLSPAGRRANSIACLTSPPSWSVSTLTSSWPSAIAWP
jgi:hypothetical protein